MPFRPELLKIRRKPFRWIIIHNTWELYKNPGAKIDNANYQMPYIFNGVLELKKGDVNYHYIIEKVKEDYIAIACRPLSFLCEWDDISPDINQRAFHVAFLGSYDLKVPEKRLYEVLSFKVINPILKIYGLSPNKIQLHNEVTNIKDLTCPGEFINKDIIIAMCRRFVVK
jgi:hypothetical protein